LNQINNYCYENDETAYRTSNTKLFSDKPAHYVLNNDDSRLKSLEIEPYMLSYEPEELAVIVSAREWMGVEGPIRGAGRDR
jgi:hypothetical protein